MKTRSIWLPLGLGWLSGMRSMAGVTAASFELRGRRVRPRKGLAGVVGACPAPLVLSALALGEAAVDKWPGAPDRTEAAGLVVRTALGAVAGAAVSRSVSPFARSGSAWRGAALGAAAAVVSTYAMLALRRRASAAAGIDMQRLGFAEDALALGAGMVLARSSR